MENNKEQLSFIEVFSIISLAASILSCALSWGGLIPSLIGFIFSLISIKAGQIKKYIYMSKIAFIISIIGLTISLTALILFGLSSTNIIPKYWGSFPYVW